MEKIFSLVIYDKQTDKIFQENFDSFEKADTEMVKRCEGKGIFHFENDKGFYIPFVGCCGYALNYAVAIFDTSNFEYYFEIVNGRKILLIRNIKDNGEKKLT